MKMTWADLFGVYDCEDDDSLVVKKRIQVRLTHVFNGCETTSYVDFDERHIDDFLAENDVKLVSERAANEIRTTDFTPPQPPIEFRMTRIDWDYVPAPMMQMEVTRG